MNTEKRAENPIISQLNNTTGPTTFVITDVKQPGEDKPFAGLPIYLLRDKGVIQSLDVDARNVIAHRSPSLLNYAVIEAYKRRADKRGLHQDKDCVVRWKPSAIPFHVEFEISVSGNTCQHLAFVKNITAGDVDRYAGNLAPLAKLFLSKPPGSDLPHLPFTRPQIPSDKSSDRGAEDKRTTETVQHARLINDRNKSLGDINIDTAETTARMVNDGKILPSLLAYLTSSERRPEGSKMSTEPQKIESRRSQPTKGPSRNAPRRPKETAPVYELQGPEPVLKHQQVVSNPEDRVKGRTVTANYTHEESSTPEDTSAVETCLPGESAAGIGSSKGKEASKKNILGRKQLVNERNRHRAISAVSAYPTQRPPRKKLARKPTTIEKSSRKQKPGPEERETEQVPMARSSTPEGSDRDDHKESATEQRLIHEEPIRRDFAYPEPSSPRPEESIYHTPEEAFDQEPIRRKFAYPESSSERHDESGYHTPEDAFDRERIALNGGLRSRNILDDDDESINSSSEVHEESRYHTPEETFDQEKIAADAKSHSSDIIDDEESIKSSSEGHVESIYHTPEEPFDQEGVAAEVELLQSDVSHCEDLTTTTNNSVAFIVPGTGARGLLWAYTTNTNVDDALRKAGMWLWEKPNTYFSAQRLLRTEKFGHSALAPVIVSHERTESDEPVIHFDGHTVHIVPHAQCWEDIRSHETHPDFLVPWKLAEYQACEAAGYQIWRHDRDLLECRRRGCGAMVSDYQRSTVVCLGCGPKTVVRYCSLQHQLEDIQGHWKECGTWRLVLQRVIDHTTAPIKFARMFPTIKQRQGTRTAALYRQRLCCALTYGHYTLFDPDLNHSETLCWPKQNPKYQEMDRRIERLLNIAFLDSWNHVILGYLYRLLRELLRCRGEWVQRTERLLTQQLELEFSNYKVNTNWNNGEDACQCEWSGKIVPRREHLSTCWAYAPGEEDNGTVRHRRCIRATVEEYEAKFWILRAWRHQYPQPNWRVRAAGYGFPNSVPDEDCYILGAGWTGWGGKEDNICKDGHDQGESSKVRKV